jgi:hypothetical protein
MSRYYNLPMSKSAPKRRSIQAHPPVLSDAARAYAKKVRGNRKLSVKFPKEAGIIEKPGVLARPYR